MPTTQQTSGLRSIGYVIVFVRDMNRSVAFYRDTLGIPTKEVTPHWTEFDLQGTTLALHGVEGEYPPAPKPLADPSQKKGVAQEIVFSASDPLRARDTLVKAGVNVSKPKMVHPAGDQVGVSCLFEDPDGNLLSVYGLVPNDVWAKQGQG